MHYCGIQPRLESPIDAIDLGCQMAAEGLGAAFTLESYAKDFIYPRPLKYYLTGDLSQMITWTLMWRETTVISSYMEEFIRPFEAYGLRLPESVSRIIPNILLINTRKLQVFFLSG